jgi:hypothetical protein
VGSAHVAVARGAGYDTYLSRCHSPSTADDTTAAWPSSLKFEVVAALSGQAATTSFRLASWQLAENLERAQFWVYSEIYWVAVAGCCCAVWFSLLYYCIGSPTILRHSHQHHLSICLQLCWRVLQRDPILRHSYP